MDESSEKKKECPILSVIFEYWGVYSPLSALFDIVSSFVAGELADWSVYLFLVLHTLSTQKPLFSKPTSRVKQQTFVSSNTYERVWKFNHNIYPESNSVLCFY